MEIYLTIASVITFIWVVWTGIKLMKIQEKQEELELTVRRLKKEN